MKKIIVILILLSGYHTSQAQSPDQQLQDALEKNASVNENETEELNPQELEELIQHPVNINSGSFENLLRLNLITLSQIEGIKQHKLKFGNLIAVQELQVIAWFDRFSIFKILPYITIKKQLVSTEQRRELFIRNKKQFSYSKGSWIDNSSLMIKLRADLTKNISAGFIAEKDAGEKITFNHEIHGFDYYSFFLSFKGSGLVKKFIVGDYRMQYGQGLTAWSGSAFSGGTILGVFKSGSGISPAISTDENNFLRGGAISISKSNWILDCWYSTHKKDAKIYKDDQTNEKYFTSFQTTGLHRYEDEIINRKKLRETYFGTTLCYHHDAFEIGVTGTRINYSVEMHPNGALYDQFDLSGKSAFNVGAYYNFSFKNTLVYGEESQSENKAFGRAHGIILSANKNLSFSMFYRSYSFEYIPGINNAFGSSSKSTNETGIYTGFSYKINRSVTLMTIADIYQFPYLKYRVDLPSIGSEFIQQFDYSPGKKLNIQLRYKRKEKQLNSSMVMRNLILENQVSQAFRFYSRFTIDDNWDYSTRIEFQSIRKSNTNITGSSISTDLFYHPKLSSCSFNFRYAVFNCKDFDARIYQFESDIPGSFSIPFYYGKGNRFYLNLTYRLGKKTNLALRYAVTNYSTGARSAEIRTQLKFNLM